ncbi:MAG: Uma2 family endonuclease [Candidatus Rokubacteria bacterium]|nr:Uma2 family endonuclease [Candidatus Rokubacteria bacterium]
MEYTIRTRRFTRSEYERLVEIGFFAPGEPVELIRGEIMVAEPQGSAHMVAIGLAHDALRAALGTGWTVRIQGPIALDEQSEPEPDVALVRGTPRSYLAGHPTHPALVIEVAESSLRLDRETKGSLYARAGLCDYWIVNLVDRVVEVYRDPVADAAAAFGWRYGHVQVLGPLDSASPLAAPAARIAIADLLP